MGVERVTYVKERCPSGGAVTARANHLWKLPIH